MALISNGLKIQLNEAILKSGMSKKDLAKKKGVAPETVSRHINHKIDVSLHDINEYASILDCNPLELFAPIDAEVIGMWTGNKELGEQKELLTSRARQSLKLKYYYSTKPTAVIITPNSADGLNLSGSTATLSLIDISSVTEQKFDPSDIGKLCYVRLSDDNLVYGSVFPQPQARFSIELVGSEILTNVDIKWARPVFSEIFYADIKSINRRQFMAPMRISKRTMDAEIEKDHKKTIEVTNEYDAPPKEQDKESKITSEFTPALVSVRDFSEMLFGKYTPGTRDTVYRWVENGTIKCIKVGRKNWIPASEVDRLASPRGND